METTLYEQRPVQVHQAIGMIAAQADCTIYEAIALIEQRAVAFDQPVGEIASAVAERRMRFCSRSEHVRPSEADASVFHWAESVCTRPDFRRRVEQALSS